MVLEICQSHVLLMDFTLWSPFKLIRIEPTQDTINDLYYVFVFSLALSLSFSRHHTHTKHTCLCFQFRLLPVPFMISELKGKENLA